MKNSISEPAKSVAFGSPSRREHYSFIFLPAAYTVYELVGAQISRKNRLVLAAFQFQTSQLNASQDNGGDPLW